MKKIVIIILSCTLFAMCTEKTTSEKYFNSGLDKYNLKDKNGAISDYTNAIKLNPKYADAYFERGNVKYVLEDYQGAISDFTEVIEIGQKFAVIYFSRGLAKAGLKDYRGAIIDYTKAIEIDPKYAEVYYNRGKAKSDLVGGIEEGCLDYLKAFELGYKTLTSESVIKFCDLIKN